MQADKMIVVPTVTLSGAALDWVVAKCEGLLEEPIQIWSRFHPSTNWLQGGPILQRLMLDGLLVEAVDEHYRDSMPNFKATMTKWESIYRGATPLEAALKCMAAAELGDQVKIPLTLAGECDDTEFQLAQRSRTPRMR